MAEKELEWKRVKCSVCDGYGVVSDYRSGDFDGAMECLSCNSGYYWISPKGRIAEYPGGLFLGRLPMEYI